MSAVHLVERVLPYVLVRWEGGVRFEPLPPPTQAREGVERFVRDGSSDSGGPVGDLSRENDVSPTEPRERKRTSTEREEALKARPGPPLARLAWLVLRYGRTGELARKLPEWVGLFAQVQAVPEGAEHLLVVTRYLLWTGDKAVHDATGQVLHSVLDEQRAEELMRSYGEELIEQGRQQGLAQGLEKGLVRGREEGLARGRAESLLRILAFRGIHVEEGARQRILDCTNMDTLDGWFDRTLQATSLSEVLDGGAHASGRKDS